ncbi:ABC transporter substrate-binding protein [Anaerocolumna sp. AGMB13025]|uniref:ABC transporter substrate-binding protein n=1 Tax=Anaerocolumna sp. AGMB13025 TaxID=3039116 RepID=UPI002420435B|nr:ABC transporter substrate-binding protein [Anaerocolumna sp. AGMB13025]WFR54771.1 ABC transporter substrate-binding protein [Anaerocolumna sp. AGMB13025]
MKKYRKIIILLIMLILSAFITACGVRTRESSVGQTEVVTEESSETDDTKTANAGNKKPIKILYGAGLCGIPLHLAKQLQFYEAEGLVEGVDYEYLTSSTPGVEMLSTGQADVTFGLIAAMLAPLDNGLEAKTVLGIHTGCIQILAGKETGITDIKGLKGKKIGVEQLASSSHIVTQRALASVGIGSTADKMEVEFVVFSKDNLPLALKNGAVDAIAIGDPQATILVKDGDAVSIFNSATSDLLKDEYCCSLWVRNEALEKYPDQVAKVVRAIQKTSVWIDQNTDLAAEIQLDNNWLVGDLDIDRHTISTFKYLPSVSGVQTALTRNILDMKDLGLIKADTDAAALAKNSFFKLNGVPDSITGTVKPPIDPKSQLKEG